VINLDIKNAPETLIILRSKRDYTPPFEIIGQYRLVDTGECPEATVVLPARSGPRPFGEQTLRVTPMLWRRLYLS